MPTIQRTLPSKAVMIWIGVCASILAIVTVLSIMILSHNTAGFQDSGVKACQTMADRAKNNTPASKKTVMTEADRQQARAPFENSRYTDIKTVGTNVVDTLYKASKDANDPNASLDDMMGDLTQISTQWTQLQVACANHGVTIPALQR